MLRSKWMWRLCVLCVMGGMVVGGKIAYQNRREWLWMPLNPKYSQAELLGLTLEEVKAKLGKPSYDPLKEYSDWDEQKHGPFYLAYYGKFGDTCVIQFKDGRVKSVALSAK